MNKHLFFGAAIIFSVIGTSSAQMSPPQFGNFFNRNQPAPGDMEAISAAETMRDRLIDPNRTFDIHLENALAEIQNPFAPRIPKEVVSEKKETPEPIRVSPRQVSTDIVPPNPQASSPNFQISGLVWNTHKPQAILDDEIVNIGDSIHGWLIINISRDGVLIESQDQTSYLIEY